MPKATFFNLPERKRNALVEVATDEFARFPYARASLSRIVSRLGIAKGSVYQYFDNKLDLYRFVLERGAQAKVAYFGDRMVPAPGAFFDWLETAMFDGLRFAAAHPRLARVSMVLLYGHEPELSGIAERIRQVGLEHMMGLIQEAQAHHEIRADVDPMTLAITISAIQQHGLFELLRVKVGAARIEDIFEDHRLDALSDDELKAIVHQLIGLLQRGAATLDGPRPVKGRRTPSLDVKDTMNRVFSADAKEPRAAPRPPVTEEPT